MYKMFERQRDERASPSELIMKQSCLSLATSIPTQITMNTSGVFV